MKWDWLILSESIAFESYYIDTPPEHKIAAYIDKNANKWDLFIGIGHVQYGIVGP